MLANIQVYFQERWQLPLHAVFLAGWLLGGGYLLARVIRQQTGKRQLNLPRGVLYSLLWGIAAFAGGAVFYTLSTTISDVAKKDWRVIPLVSAAVAVVLIGYAMLYALLQMPLKQLIKKCALPIGAVLGLTIVIITVEFIPARIHFLHTLRINDSIRRLQTMDKAIRSYEREVSTDGTPPQNLAVLKQKLIVVGKPKQFLTPDFLQLPVRHGLENGVSDKEIGYFYYPAASIREKDKTDKLRACELDHPESNDGRVVLFLNGNCGWISNDDFMHKLKLPENEEFSKQFQKAQAKN